MKSLIILVLTLLISIPSFSQEENLDNTTTYYFIRHAEKDRSDKTNRNPELTKTGKKRAKLWKKYFKKIDLDAVYSSNYNRTIQTAQPTAKHHKLEIKFYDPRQLFSELFKEDTKGKTVLVVGHSNTTPAFVNAILESKKYEDIDDTDNSQLFIVTISNGQVTDEVVSIPLR